ncbi:major facilitator transporter [Streptomyces viridochromogenes DSM 40736]|uniref:Major facilitator transporter n=2 Tax=Streptomyces viridochromogenes TaxID=1938 RepID=D9XF26_STRVT|nr:MFS transporter [Streptomyces viridochromogenes]AAU00095.1 putative ORF416 [Streptomyces viridochromogenes]EFL30505.1 major facilitator transporter [Streptomyces viridochromogenes DSM 40736]
MIFSIEKHREGSRAAPALRRALAALSVTEIVSWGTLYYAFPVSLPSITGDTGWPTTATMCAFSLGLIASAVAGIPVGRLLDRYGPRWVMSAGSVLGCIALVAVATAPGLPWFTAAWALAGVAQAMALYPPAFAALTRWYGPRRLRPLTLLSLAGGLASVVFAPITALLLAHLDWRTTFLLLAAVLLVTATPLHLFCLRAPWPGAEERRPGTAFADVRPVILSREFALLAAALALAALSLYATTLNLVPFLVERGFSTGIAAGALALCGTGQILGRLGYPALTRRTTTQHRMIVLLSAGAVAIGFLAIVPGPAPLLCAAAMAAGAVRGMFTLLQATAVSDRWGVRSYATLNAFATAPAGTALAVAPAAGALLAAGLSSYPGAFLVLAALVAAGAALAAMSPAGMSPAGMSPTGDGGP